MTDTATPERIFKLCTAGEAAKFYETGQICSTLDATDGFIHLSGERATLNFKKRIGPKLLNVSCSCELEYTTR